MTVLTVPHCYLDRQFDYNARKAILSAIERVAERGDFTLGQEVAEFERRFAELVGASPSHVVAVQSGTAALELLLRAHGIGPGDEVIVPSLTFFASVGAIVAVGATPVYCEVGSDLLMDAFDVLNKCLTDKTAAVLPVHYCGAIADVERLRHQVSGSVPIIQDAAQAVGAVPHTDASAAYSLHPLKNLNVWGDGGVAVAPTDAIAGKLRLLRNHGLSDRDHISVFGHNQRMSTVQAAVACTVMDLYDVHVLNAKRREIAERYSEAAWDCIDRLRGCKPVFMPPCYSEQHPAYHLYIGRMGRYEDSMSVLEPSARARYIHHMRSRGIDAKIHYPIPTHMQYASIKKLGAVSLPHTEALARSIVTLPLHPWLTEDEIQRVCKAIREWEG